MIQNDCQKTFIYTIDISDLQADLPDRVSAACTPTTGVIEDNVITLVDPDTLTTPPVLQKQNDVEYVMTEVTGTPPVLEKEDYTSYLILNQGPQLEIESEDVIQQPNQEIVQFQEEPQQEFHEVPQSEIVIETAEEVYPVQDQIVLELDPEPEPQAESPPLQQQLQQQDSVDLHQHDEEFSDDMSLMDDDLASLLSEDMDDELRKAAVDANKQQSVTPIIKQELRTVIQHRRVQDGKEELKLNEPRKRAAPSVDDEITEEGLERKRKRRERNKVAAQRCRNKKKELADELEEETMKLSAQKEKHKEEIESLKREKELLMTMLRFHDASRATKCGRKLSQSDEGTP